MFLVGLTGGIGSGKSTVAEMFAERGAEVVDADQVAREVVEPGTPGFSAVVARFGDEVVTPGGDLDRARLAEIVFGDEEARNDLNAIVHPLVGERIAARLGELRQREGVVVVDVPLLVEAGVDRGYEAIVVVTAPEDTRVARVVESRGMTTDEARDRIGSQASDDERIAVATHVVDNAGDLDALRQAVDGVWRDLVERARAGEGGT
ncbi:MAG: dephospho-CoA kinase [Nitriliruptorales bacterium]